jgi:hypothetical protein
MIKTNLLLTLFIHRFSRETYYQKFDDWVGKQKALVESAWNEPFSNLPEERQLYFRNQWFWAPWRYNNLVGFAEIVMETDWTIIASLYLKRGRYSFNKPFLLDYDFACASENFEPGNLKSLQEAIKDISKQIEEIIKPKRWVLEFDDAIVNNTDFFKMIEEGKKKQNHEN